MGMYGIVALRIEKNPIQVGGRDVLRIEDVEGMDRVNVEGIFRIRERNIHAQAREKRWEAVNVLCS